MFKRYIDDRAFYRRVLSFVNQLMFVFNLSIFGANSGASIFRAQFHGSCDLDKVRQSFRFKMLASTILTAAGLAIFMTLKTPLINLYVQGGGAPPPKSNLPHTVELHRSSYCC